MELDQIHFEVFIRRKSGDPWKLELATEDRAAALKLAEELLKTGKAVGARVSKETLDAETREFKSISIFSQGEVEQKKKKAPRENLEPLCVSPQDLYSLHARDRIGRLLEGFLSRNKATPFELLHRADLAEKLDAAGMDLQHAIQKVAIPEAAERGVSVHELIRAFQKLAQATIDRVLKDGRKGVFPDIAKEGFDRTAERLTGDPDRHYLLGGAVAVNIGPATSWSDKVNRLLDLADAAPSSPTARLLAFQVLEQPLAEILGTRAGMAELLGSDLDLGGMIAAMTRLVAADAVEALTRIEPTVARVMPPLEGPAARLANWLEGSHFEGVRKAILRRVMAELTGPRRLRPTDATSEIELLRALAMTLTAAAGKLLTPEEVQEAFVARSQLLVRSDFVEAFLGETKRSAIEEIQGLLWLAENVAGAANKRQANRWIAGNVASLRFETELRQSAEAPTTRLAALADLQRRVMGAGMVREDSGPIAAKIGEVGGAIEADCKVTATIARANLPLAGRLNVLLRLGSGEAAPFGPAADRARGEAGRLIRLPEAREALAQYPDLVDRVRALTQGGMAA
ncbi:hypothetical protein [Phenylobacterium montanum]|uniref:Uncharacterized protein n=1 Tax=Phenylobacterium montanum TaxID=2823693 RepID=A0A975IST4_9CAUL|nr:hypothetical protein [Caulobacter sp. S6]QUD86025.1 hypothetical protein KCG34_13000 [Caulobacter sp. S6]